MNNFFVLILVVLLSACGRLDKVLSPSGTHTVRIDQELISYVLDFQKEWSNHFDNARVHDLIVEFGEIKQDKNKDHVLLGNCYIDAENPPRITIDPGMWNTLSDTQKEILMYHELGHCVLIRKHVDSKNGVSIMNPFLISDSTYQDDKQNILDELFDPSTYNTWDVFNVRNCKH